MPHSGSNARVDDTRIEETTSRASGTTSRRDTPANDNPSLEPTPSEVRELLQAHAAHGLLPSDPASVPVANDLTRALKADDGPAALAALVELRYRGGAHDAALTAVEQFFDAGQTIELRALAARNPGAWSHNWRVGDDRTAARDFLRAHDGNANLYVGVNPRAETLAGTTNAARAADVADLRHVVFDFDYKSAPADDPRWERRIDQLCSLGPARLISTGNGSHVWFQVKGAADPNALNRIMRAIGSDPVADAPRIMRMPGTINIPTASKRRRGARYALAHVVERADLRSKIWTVGDLQREACRAAGLHPDQQPDRTEASGSGTDAAGNKAPHPAPSIDLFRQLLAELPNHAGGPFDDRDAWVNLAHAAKGAAVAGGIEADGREAFLGWSGQWGGALDDAARLWDTCTMPNTGWGSLKNTLLAVNPDGWSRMQTAEASAAFGRAGIEPQQLALLTGTPVQPVCSGPVITPLQLRASTAIPPRQWVYGRVLIRGHVSLVVAPGGVGKSSMTLVEALAMASGRALLGHKPHGALRVWLWNGEDPQDELDRRIAAARTHHSVSDADMGGRLFVGSGRSTPIKLARAGREGTVVDRAFVEAMVVALSSEQIDVLIADPFVTTHDVPENDNTAMNAVVAAWREIADRAGCAVLLVHHTNKAGASEADGQGIYSSRGAGAVIDGVRSARFLTRMTKDEAARFGVVDHWRYFRVQNGKANLAPPEEAEWLRTVSVALNNGTVEFPHGDEVGVVEAWSPPKATDILTVDDLRRVQDAIDHAGQPPRADERADEWAGYLIADAMCVDIGEPGQRKGDRTAEQNAARGQVRQWLAAWVDGGWLIRDETSVQAHRRPTPIIRVGQRPQETKEVEAFAGTGGAAQ